MNVIQSIKLWNICSRVVTSGYCNIIKLLAMHHLILSQVFDNHIKIIGSLVEYLISNSSVKPDKPLDTFFVPFTLLIVKY